MNAFLAGKRVCVTGGAGFLGRAVVPRLHAAGVADVFIPRSREFDLTDRQSARRMLDAARPEVIVHLAAEVGGIGANRRRPGRFFFANMAMGLNLIEEARIRGVAKFVQVGSVCAYPKHCQVPFIEADLWSGYPEETNAPYGVTKRALGVMLDAYHREYGLRSAFLLPVNLYGPHDNFDPEWSHVIPALIRRFCEAVSRGEHDVTCWGSGRVTREFLFVDDAAEAIVRAAEKIESPGPINVGSGREIQIARLAEMVAEKCGYRGAIRWDEDQPDGQPRRMLDTSRARRVLGWKASTLLEDGLARTIRWWKECKPAPAPDSECQTVA